MLVYLQLLNLPVQRRTRDSEFGRRATGPRDSSFTLRQGSLNKFSFLVLEGLGKWACYLRAVQLRA